MPNIENTTVQDDAIVRGCAYPFGGTISGTAIMDHDYSMGSSVTSGVHFSHCRGAIGGMPSIRKP